MKMHIATLTLNPSLDKTMYFDAPFKAGALNRASHSAPPIVGSKGINVSRMLHVCGVESVAMGFVGGENGRLACAQLNSQGIIHDLSKKAKPPQYQNDRPTIRANERGGPIAWMSLADFKSIPAAVCSAWAEVLRVWTTCA